MYNFTNHRIQAVCFNNFHLYFSIVQQNNFIPLHILRKRIVSYIYLVIVAYALVGSYIYTGSVNQVNTAVFYQADTDLGALQVGQYANVGFILLVDAADQVDHFFMVVCPAMRKIEPANIYAGLYHS